jgi:hypothetical protein
MDQLVRPRRRFDRIGAPKIESTDQWSRKRAVAHGRWVPNEEGAILHRAGWDEINPPAERAEDFVFRRADGNGYLSCAGARPQLL